MTKTEIDRRLALAIGYPADRVRNVHGWVQVWNDINRMDGPMPYSNWQRFDHTDWAVMGPIAARFDAFPMKVDNGDWVALICGDVDVEEQDTHPATASALAVIRHFESKA